MLLLASSLWMLVSFFLPAVIIRKAGKHLVLFLLAAVVVADALNPKPFRV